MSSSFEPILRDHIASGIELLQAGSGMEAYDHFISSKRAPGLEGNVNVALGMIFPVGKLQTENDLVWAASTVARHSRAGDRTAEIAGWHDGRFSTELTDPTKYDQDLAQVLYQEAGTVAAEEWLHILQAVSGEPLAEQSNVEVDVAAYLAGQGVVLSADYMTRYFERANWCVGAYPERTDEIHAFAKKFGRKLLTV